MTCDLKAFIQEMPAEKYLMLVGTGDKAPGKAFNKKKSVHPGVGGRPIQSTLAGKVWDNMMAKSIEESNARDRKRMAYIHVPFCSHICLYCGFFQNKYDQEKEQNYVEHLLKDLEMAKGQTLVQEKPFQCVFFGGGTPSCLSPKNISRVLKKIHECLPLTNDCEITMEARIHDLTPDRVEAWFNNGVNRVSIGVQSFDTTIRQNSGRIDDENTVKERLKMICSYDQASIIIDLIFGLPGQTVESFIHDLEIIDELPISGMDLYQLNLWENSLMQRAIQQGKLPAVADREMQGEMFAASEKWLQDRAYKRLSNCHWSKDIRERSMYNILAKTDGDIFPFGCGAGGHIGNYTMMLHRDLKMYLAAVDKGEKPIMFMAEKSQYHSLHGMINQNMEQGYFNLNGVAKKYGKELLQLEYLLDIWCTNGLMIKGDAMYFQTQNGRFWQNNLNQALLECAEYILGD